MARPDNPATVYLDSSAIIAAIKKEPGYEPVQRVLEAADAKRLTLVVSTLLIVEARGVGRNAKVDPDTENAIRSRLLHPDVMLVELDRLTAVKARDLAYRYNLKGAPDAVHLASAVIAGADVFIANDGLFPYGQDVEGVWVSRPYFLGGPDLFAQENP